MLYLILVTDGRKPAQVVDVSAEKALSLRRLADLVQAWRKKIRAEIKDSAFYKILNRPEHLRYQFFDIWVDWYAVDLAMYGLAVTAASVESSALPVEHEQDRTVA